MNDYFKVICQELNLGELIEESSIVVGGLTNKIYKVATDKATYAFKIINNDNIKNNPNLLKNIELSEVIANVAKDNGINAVSALKFNGTYIQSTNGLYLLVYQWINGKILLTKEITLNHLIIVANSLAKLHKIKVEGNRVKYLKINYKHYFDLLSTNEEEWSIFFKDNFDELNRIYDIVYDNYDKLSNQVSYVHKDLNRKNIMWSNDIPYIIDWETVTIGNPSLDFFNSSWFLTADVDIDKYYTFAKEYLSIMNLKDNVENSAYAAIIDECNWLEFSLKRALGIHSNNKEEIDLGKNSIKSSLTEILNYHKEVPLMLDIINEIDDSVLRKI